MAPQKWTAKYTVASPSHDCHDLYAVLTESGELVGYAQPEHRDLVVSAPLLLQTLKTLQRAILLNHDDITARTFNYLMEILERVLLPADERKGE